MQALDLRDHALQWETERQNRIHHETIEQKKKQAGLESVRREPLHPDSVFQPVPIPTDEWIEKIHRVPNIRSALIPLEDDLNVEGWSKPFSLCKAANIEPWLSFYKGYQQSRLFIGVSSAARGDRSEEQPTWQLDFPVRALLELKQVSATLILEPPVQIDGQVEYPDVEDELRNCRDPMRIRSLLKYIDDTHNAQLRMAVERGNEMGNCLHDALMGEGHVNLIKAWTKVYKRNPTVDELHRLLTTGRVKVSTERKPLAKKAEESMPESAFIAPVLQVVPETQPDVIVLKEKPRPADMAKAERKAVLEQSLPVAQEPEKGVRKNKILLYLLQAVGCCAALAAIAFSF